MNDINFLEGDTLGQSTNYGNRDVSAITFGLGDVGAYSMNNNEINHFVNPKFMDHLPEKLSLPKPGPVENVEEIPSSTDYYDGSVNLNVKKISCKIYGNANDCLHHSSCGWCGSSNSCILGNNLGPLQSCLRSSFLYSSPVPSWKPELHVQNNGGDGIQFSLSNNNQ